VDDGERGTYSEERPPHRGVMPLSFR